MTRARPVGRARAVTNDGDIDFGESISRLSEQEPARTLLCLFGGLSVLRGSRRIAVPEASRRLVVLVSPCGVGGSTGAAPPAACGRTAPDVRAAANLRSALWRLRETGLDLLEGGRAVALSEGVDVDVQHEVAGWADRLVRGHATAEDLVLEGRRLHPDDMLPGWYEDWVIFERERIRQRILHGLEALSNRLRLDGRHGEAVEAALCAVHLKPLRESAQRVLLLGHLAEGNRVEARRELGAYAHQLKRELRLPVNPELAALVGAAGPRRMRLRSRSGRHTRPMTSPGLG
jgi:hypothetical protein